MARNKGPIQFEGSLGNIRSYYDKSLRKYILSTKGGANRDLIMNNPSFARTRDCMNEFTACSKWASTFRKSLLCLAHLMYSRFFAGVVKLAKEIQLRDEVGTFGFRSIEASKIPSLLKEINLNQEHPFTGVNRDPISITFSEDKRTARFTMCGFVPGNGFNWRMPFSKFRFYLVIAQLSDWVWNERDHRYYPVVDNLRGLTRMSVSDWMVKNYEPVDIQMDVSFDEPALSQPGTTVIVVLGVEMATLEAGGSVYITPGNGTAGMVGCFS